MFLMWQVYAMIILTAGEMVSVEKKGGQPGTRTTLVAVTERNFRNSLVKDQSFTVSAIT
jgi:hypothetical protein